VFFRKLIASPSSFSFRAFVPFLPLCRRRLTQFMIGVNVTPCNTTGATTTSEASAHSRGASSKRARFMA
jgi:hypothetical protein